MKRRALIVLFAVLFSPLFAAAQPLADRIPDDAIFYFGWRGADAPGPGYSESRLKAFLDASALPQLINEALPKVLDKLGEKDRGAAIFRELLGKLGPAYWHHPVAFYIGPVDGLNVAQPMPRIALLCQAGAGAAQLKKDINAQLDQLLVNSLVPVTAIEEDGIVAITLGNVTPDLAAKSKTTLPYRKEFTDAMAQVGKDPLLVAYADIESLTALIDHAITNVPQAAEKWQAIRDTLGLGGLKRIAWTAGFDGRDFATNGLILAPAPRTGLLQLLDAGPITDEALRAVPKSATMLLAGKIDFAKLLSMLRTIGGKFDPAAPDRINSGLAIANVVVGLNIEKDLIEPFGDEWLAYTAPTVGGVGPLGLVVVNRARDAAKLEQSLGMVEKLINDKINSDTATGAPRGNFMQAKIDGLNVHYFNTPFVSPAWTIKNGNLYVALYPQTAVAAADATGGAAGGGSILDNEDYRGSLKRLGAVKPSQITYFDLPKSAPVGYPYMLALTRVLGFADMFGMQTPPAVLPSIGKLIPLLSPAASAAWTDDMGMHTRSVTPFPGATLLGGPEVIIAEGGGLIAPAIAGAREKARKESLGQK